MNFRPIVIINAAEETSEMAENSEFVSSNENSTVGGIKINVNQADTDSKVIKTNLNDKIMISVSIPTTDDNTSNDRNSTKLNETVNEMDIDHNDINCEIESKQQLNSINNTNIEIINKMSENSSEINLIASIISVSDSDVVLGEPEQPENEMETPTSDIVDGKSENQKLEDIPVVAGVEEPAETENVRIVLGNEDEVTENSENTVEVTPNVTDESSVTPGECLI